jgi:hypothetical protein
MTASSTAANTAMAVSMFGDHKNRRRIDLCRRANG